MDYLKKNPKLVQLGVVLIGFVVLILMTGQYSEIIDVRDGFTKAVEKGQIVPVTGFSESVSMILSGQLPPQFVRIPELNFQSGSQCLHSIFTDNLVNYGWIDI